jgi:cation diffusion facilitator family transporter
LYKLENILSIVLALMIFYTAYEFVHDALTNPMRETQIEAWMFGGLVLVMAIPLIYSHYLMKIGKRANSPALTATAKEFRTHVFTTGVVFISLISANTDLPIEQIGIILIAIIIIKSGWELLMDGILALLDASLSRELLDQIQALIIAEPEVANVQWISGRNAGRVRFVEAGVVLHALDPNKITKILQRIEAKIRENVAYIERVLIHVEAEPRTYLRYAIPLENTNGTLSDHFSQAPYFTFFDLNLDDRSIKDQHFEENPCRDQEKAGGILVAEWLVEQKVDVVLSTSPRQGKGPGYVFNNAGVREQIIQASTLNEVLREIVEAEN